MSVSQLQDLGEFLGRQGIVCDSLDRKERSAALGKWTSIFGSAFCEGNHYKEGHKARYALGQVAGGSFFLLSITNEMRIFKSSAQGPRWGYTCKASVIPDLGQFCNLDFAMVASDYSGTMVYTHEDFILGGPYFVERSWLELPPQTKKSRSGHGRSRR